jgi:secretion/DNA translocation related TadE-like protein
MKESGSVSVLTVTAVMLLLVMVPLVVDMGAIVKARGRAHNAADAAALAAAQELVAGGNPSAAAAEYAAKNNADVTGLSIGVDSVTVSVDADFRLTLADKFGIKLGPVSGQGKAELLDVEELDY